MKRMDRLKFGSTENISTFYYIVTFGSFGDYVDITHL